MMHECAGTDVLDASADGIIWLDDRWRVEWANQALCRMHGRARAELVGCAFETLYPGTFEPVGGRFDARGRRADDSLFAAELTIGTGTVGGRPIRVVVARDVTERMLLQRRVVDGAEQRLARIGHDLHDSLGQLLTGVAFIMKGMERELAPSQAARVAYAVELINDGIRTTRELARGLSPATFEHRTLRAALTELVRTCTDLFEVPCSLDSVDAVEPRSWAVRRELYFIAREAITNAVRHGQPTRVEVALCADAAGQILSVRDDGVGIDTRSLLGGGLGLRSMRQRAQMIGGQLEIQRLPGGGTGVRCRWHE